MVATSSQQFSGKQVQRVHMELALQKHVWPTFALPLLRGFVSAAQVVAAPEGAERNQLIHAWCASVWEAFRESHQAVAGLLSDHRIVTL
jgi:hypothetical protein